MFETEIAKFPAEPPRSPSLLPGLTPSSVFARQNAFPFVLVGLFAVFPLLIMMSDQNVRLSFRGKNTDAEVVSIADAHGPSEARDITYSFISTTGSTFRGSCRCGKNSAYFNVKAGDHVPVRYLPSDPSINHIANSNDRNEPPVFIFLIFPIFGLAMFSPLYGPRIKAWFRVRSVFANGLISKGSVVFVKQIGPSWPNYMRTSSDIYISFRLRGGETVEGKTTCANEWLLNHLPPGTEVNIAYIPSKPADVVLLDEYMR